MGTKAKNEVTKGGKAVIDRCKQLIQEKGIPVDEFLKRTGMSRNYWYKRYRYEAPLTTTDIELIADAIGVSQLDIYKAACRSDVN